MKILQEKQNFFSKLLVNWLASFSILIPLCFCFYTYDSAQVKLTLFYIASLGAFALWVASLISRGERILNKENLFIFLPLLVYAFYITGSYFFEPYRLARLDNFAKETACLALFFVVSFEFKEEDFKLLLKYFFAGALIVFSYGLLQIFNLDFLPWKNFFKNRVFATLANPNLLGSYALFTAILIFFSYLIKRSKGLIFLFILALINLIFTQSKGAWFSFALCVLVGSALFVYFFKDTYKKNKQKILAVSLILILFSAGSIFYFSARRIQSVSFRMSTWRATWDMVEAKALTGTGIGSFEIIYPAYKRPEIFYIEQNLHNVQTQHAENYYLETLTELGFLGFGLFLWVLFYILKQVIYKLKILVKQDNKKAFLLAGFTLASASIYIHNFVDVSVYFASTTFFLILFNGAIFNLAFGPFKKDFKEIAKDNKIIFKITFIFSLIILSFIYFYIQKDFWNNFFLSYQNSFLQVLYCIGFIIISLALFSLLVYLMFKIRKILFCIFIIFAGILCYFIWCQFISNAHFSRATALAEKGRLEALPYYTQAINKNPLLPELYYFRGLLLLNRFSLVENRDIFAGDKKEMSNDFKRALRDFNKAKKLAPDMALLHYNLASLYLKNAQRQNNLFEREKFYHLAQDNFKTALLLDPVYENTYFQLANIELAKASKEGAIYWLKKYLNGPEEVKNPEYLKTHKNNKKAKEVLVELQRG